MRKLLPAALAIALAAGFLFLPQQTAAGASQGIGTCLSVLVPSLFPFMAVTIFLVKSGVSAAIGRRLGGPLARLLALPPAAAPAVLMGMVGGYPTGARGVEALYEMGALDAEEAGRMLLFSVNAGPAFVCTAVGAGFLGSARAGVMLLLTHLAAGLVLGILLGLPHHKKKSKPTASGRPALSAGQALIASVHDAASAMLMMCAFVVAFSAVLALLQSVLSGKLLMAAASFCEVTLGCRTLAGTGAPLWCISLALGWGGLCVHLQCLQGLSFPVHMGKFFLCRAAQGVLAAAFTAPFTKWVWLPTLPPAVEVFGSGLSSRPALSGSIAAGAALVVLCAVAVLDAGKKESNVL